MPISGLVLTLVDDEALATHAVETLRTMGSITLGELQPGRKLPLATDAATIEAQATLWQDITRVPGVLLIDLVFEDFSDVEPESFSSDELPSRWRDRAHKFNVTLDATAELDSPSQPSPAEEH